MKHKETPIFGCIECNLEARAKGKEPPLYTRDQVYTVGYLLFCRKHMNLKIGEHPK